MDNAKKQAQDLINKAKNMKEFVVERDWDLIPMGVVKYDIKHKQGHLAKIFVHALTQEEAEYLVDTWLSESVE
jgi:hypothetical protein